MARERSVKNRVHEFLELSVPGDRWGYYFDYFMMILIVANVAAIVLETVPEIDAVARGFFPRIDRELMWVSMRDGDTVYKHQKLDADSWGIQVFDLAADPGETTNLYDSEDPRHAEMAAQLADYKARLVAGHSPAGRVDPTLLPEEVEAELLRRLGYIQ